MAITTVPTENKTVKPVSFLSWILVLLFSLMPLLIVRVILYITDSDIEKLFLISQLFLVSLAIVTEASVRGVCGLFAMKHKKVIKKDSTINIFFTVIYGILLTCSVIIYIVVFAVNLIFALREHIFQLNFNYDRLMMVALILTALSFVVGFLFQLVELCKSEE